MGWKNVKEHYRIVHQVQVTEAGICIGSPYIHNIIVISPDGKIVKEDDRTLNDHLMRYQQEMKADLDKLKDLVTSPDTFAASVPVYTYDGATIVEKQCEEPGWPNVTHDGLMMYENTFSTDRTKVVEWAKRNCLARIDSTRRYISEQKERIASLRERLREAENDAEKLGIDTPPPQTNVAPDAAARLERILRLGRSMKWTPHGAPALDDENTAVALGELFQIFFQDAVDRALATAEGSEG